MRIPCFRLKSKGLMTSRDVIGWNSCICAFLNISYRTFFRVYRQEIFTEIEVTKRSWSNIISKAVRFVLKNSPRMLNVVLASVVKFGGEEVLATPDVSGLLLRETALHSWHLFYTKRCLSPCQRRLQGRSTKHADSWRHHANTFNHHHGTSRHSLRCASSHLKHGKKVDILYNIQCEDC